MTIHSGLKQKQAMALGSFSGPLVYLETVVGMVGIGGPQEVELDIVLLVLKDLLLKGQACTI